MRKSFALMMLMFSGFALGEGRSANAAQTVAQLRAMVSPPAAAIAVRLCAPQLSAPAGGGLAQRQAWHRYTLAHNHLQYTLALYAQGLTTDEQLMAAAQALAHAESGCSRQNARSQAPDGARHFL